jgi:acyl-CoA dehydrogenase
MNFAYSDKTKEYQDRLNDFMDSHIYPGEAVYDQEVAQDPQSWESPAIIDKLKDAARERDLWNLFLPHSEFGAGLSNLEYAPLAEISGRSPLLAPEVMNCSAPDTGNMELLSMFATADQKERWLMPLLDGEIRSCYGMTEPAVASSDASNIALAIRRDGDEYVLSGRKWWSSGAMSSKCELAIVMGVTNPDADRHSRHSMVLVPLDTEGVTKVRSTTVLGFTEAPQGGHAEVNYDNVRIPVSNLLGEEGNGFGMAQARLGPGRIHHCMRLVGMAERALDLMCDRASRRVAFGTPLIEQGVIQEWIAESRIRIEQVRLLVLKTAWLMDTVGNKGARTEISAIKVAAPAMTAWVVDRAIQTFGGAGVSGDTPLAMLYSQARLLQLADGPDEVHRRSVARQEIRRSQDRNS